ncbi:cardiolipin synthase [Oribacterium sp. P6A1]|uniref:cardiolipin synthase n=1 Tax=Oribacterium sp. P6A1 TaxID=1410612 RepID=UPI00056C4383|nr:cardiolipin synthase [Oribacterium sp. P6A1]
MNETLETKSAVKNGVSRMVFAIISILIEVGIIILLNYYLFEKWLLFSAVFRIIGVMSVLYLYGRNYSSSLKMPWMMLIMAVPVAGLVFYLLAGLNSSTHKMRKRYEDIDKLLLPKLPEGNDAQNKLQEANPYIANITHYLKKYSGYPVYHGSKITYYDDALKGLKAQKEALKSAKHFIFMEYHAIEDGTAWNELETILEMKVKEGLDVRVFYDDMGSIGFINTDFVKKLENKGIACRVFNPFAPGLNLFLNNRDHRKITVIDGDVGFTGGYNLADEYFHLREPFGFWKDTGIKIEGEAVKNLTVTFLEMWNAVNENDTDDRDYDRFLNCEFKSFSDEDFAVPYADSPMDDEQVGEEVYISIAEGAKDYAWFVTPYLIITDEMIHTLSLAAKRGVDVRIITPGIPDKKIVYSVTRSYYSALVKNGVRIFEYTPGFCHCKMSVSDDVIATCGTINMDYRSFYHHFENGCLYADCKAVIDTKKDFEEMFKVSTEVTEYYRTGQGAFLKFGQLILRLFAPLM